MSTSGGGRPPGKQPSPQSTMIGIGKQEPEAPAAETPAAPARAGLPPPTRQPPSTRQPPPPRSGAPIPRITGQQAPLARPSSTAAWTAGSPPSTSASTAGGSADPPIATAPSDDSSGIAVSRARTSPPRPPPGAKTPPFGSPETAAPVVAGTSPSQANTAPSAAPMAMIGSGANTAPTSGGHHMFGAPGAPANIIQQPSDGHPMFGAPGAPANVIQQPSGGHPMFGAPGAPANMIQSPSGPTVEGGWQGSGGVPRHDGSSPSGATGHQPPGSAPPASGPTYGQWHGGGQAPLPQARVRDDDADLVPGSEFVKFLKISTRRAFRLRIEPSEVLPEEREALVNANPPIHDPNLQSFLAWRRSVLFLVAVSLIPLTIIGLISSLQNTQFKAIIVVKLVPAIAEALFCYICWTQLKKWAFWRTQRRWLFLGWVVFMLTPFVVFVYPLRTFFAEAGSFRKDALAAFNMEGVRTAMLPFMLSMLAMLQLAPKAISLMPGLIRASMVIKLLFPGSPAPGWLIVMASPLYALLVYVILIIPYQFTGSGWFIMGIVGLVLGQVVLARAGFSLATPLSDEETLVRIKRIRTMYVGVMVFSALMIVIALGSFVKELRMPWVDVFTAVLKFETNVLILTMIGSDLVVTNLDRARRQTVGRTHIEQETELKIAAFVSVEAPHAPPPPGPAGT